MCGGEREELLTLDIERETLVSRHEMAGHGGARHLRYGWHQQDRETALTNEETAADVLGRDSGSGRDNGSQGGIVAVALRRDEGTLRQKKARQHLACGN